MLVRINVSTGTVNVKPQVARVVRVYNYRVPSGIAETEFTAKGDILVGTGAGTFAPRAVGSDGQFLQADSAQADGIKWGTPSIAITDATNFLLNGGFDFAQRTTPGTLTTVSDNAYGADRWKQTRENADLQYQRNDASSESGLTSLYYGKYKKITNAGKIMVFQILEGIHTLPLRGKTVIFQAKMKASTAKTIRMAIIQLQTAGTMDTIPTPVSAWNVDSTDPTLGTNLAVVTGAESKSVTTSWANFSVSVTVPGDCKNLICAIWSDADFSAADELNIAEAGLFLGSTSLSWTPRNTTHELILCQRYYWKSFAIDTPPASNTSVNNITFIANKAGATANGVYYSMALPAILRTASPTLTSYNPSAANAQVRDLSFGDCSATSVTTDGTLLFISATGNASTLIGSRCRVGISIDADL